MALAIGETIEVHGSAAQPYKVKNVDNYTYTCTCFSWKTCRAPVNQKTCKHLRSVLGAAAEAARIGGTGGAAPSPVLVASPVARLAPATGDAAISSGESPDEMLAAIFGKKTIIEVSTTEEGARKLQGMTTLGGYKVLSVTPEDPVAAYKQSLIDRAAAEGRNLRQDEIAKVHGPPILLAHKWDGEVDPTGHLLSEKRDGVRAYWDGREFVSRQGNMYQAPAFFKAGLPDHPLDGELIIGRGQFSETISVVKRLDAGDAWLKITYEVFDAPNHPGGFETRIAYCKQIIQNAPHAMVLDQVICTGIAHLKHELARIEALGGEGVMIRKSNSRYEVGRSHTLLKVKSFFDTEVELTGFLAGKGKFKGMVGSFDCKLPNGVTFNVGSGLSDALRKNPPKIGSIVTVRYQELSKDGVPRFPSFVAVRDYE